MQHDSSRWWSSECAVEPRQSGQHDNHRGPHQPGARTNLRENYQGSCCIPSYYRNILTQSYCPCFSTILLSLLILLSFLSLLIYYFTILAYIAYPTILLLSYYLTILAILLSYYTCLSYYFYYSCYLAILAYLTILPFLLSYYLTLLA